MLWWSRTRWLENLDEIKNDRGHQDASPTKEESNSLRRSVAYSISQIIPFVNKKDLLRYLPDGMLTKNQRIKCFWCTKSSTSFFSSINAMISYAIFQDNKPLLDIVT